MVADGVLDRNVTLRAGGDISFDDSSLAQGLLDAEADSAEVEGDDGQGDVQTSLIETLGGSVLLTGENLTLGQITTDGGNVSLTGGGVGLGGGISTAAGSLTITADTLAVVTLPPGSISGTGALTIQPRDPLQSIGLGAAVTAGLDLPQATLDLFANGFDSMTFGRADKRRR